MKGCHWCEALQEPHENHALPKEFYDGVIGEDKANQDAHLTQQALDWANQDIPLTIRFGRYVACQPEQADVFSSQLEEALPWRTALMEAIGCDPPPVPPWRRVVRNALLRQRQESQEFKQILRRLGAK